MVQNDVIMGTIRHFFIMSLEAQLCWTLICLLFTVGGSAQSTLPPQCVQTFRIEQDRIDLYIMPGIVNCFSCALDTAGGSVSWQVEMDGDLVPVSTSPDIVVNGNFLVIAMPDNYVQPGTSGRRDIRCSANDRSLEARLASPILQQPLFSSATITVNEGELLELTCITRNIPDITTIQILDQHRMPLHLSTSFGIFRVSNVTRNYAGVYTCVVTSTLDNSTVNETSVVIVEYAPEIIASNLSSHNILLGEIMYLQCSYNGVPAPIVQWFHNNILLMDGVNGITINTNHNTTSILKDEVERTSGGTYACRASNSVGTDQKSYSIILVSILTPDAPSDTNILCMSQVTISIIIALACGLLILFALLIVIIIAIFVRRKKKPQRESDDNYEAITINIGHPPPVIETKLNVAYCQPKK